MEKDGDSTSSELLVVRALQAPDPRVVAPVRDPVIDPVRELVTDPMSACYGSYERPRSGSCEEACESSRERAAQRFGSSWVRKLPWK